MSMETTWADVSDLPREGDFDMGTAYGATWSRRCGIRRDRPEKGLGVAGGVGVSGARRLVRRCGFGLRATPDIRSSV